MAGEAAIPTAHDRLERSGARVLSDAELLTILLGPTAGANNTRAAAQSLLDAHPLSEIAWASSDELQQTPGIGPARAAAIAAAFELGRRGCRSPVFYPGGSCDARGRKVQGVRSEAGRAASPARARGASRRPSQSSGPGSGRRSRRVAYAAARHEYLWCSPPTRGPAWTAAGPAGRGST